MDVTGAETDKVFNLVLRNLASTAPPIPGFRRQKGGQLSCFFFGVQLFSYQMAELFLKECLLVFVIS